LLLVFSSNKSQLPKFGIGIVCVVFAMILVKLIPDQCCSASQVEGFSAESTGTTMCPIDTKTYTDRLGNTNCCSGQVNGNHCDGTVVCTFSGSGKYPICGGNSRRRKWFGPIDTWVLEWMRSDFEEKFKQVLNYMKAAYAKVGSIDKRLVPRAAIDAFKALLDEEIAWNADILKERVKDAAPFQEEVMYIINEVTNIINTHKIDRTVVQKQVTTEMCATSTPVNSIWPLYQNNKLATFNISKGDYVLSFDITIQGVLAPWTSILHVSTGTDGSRAPAIFLWPNDTRLHIRIGDTSNANWGLDTDSLPIGKKTRVSIVAKDTSVAVSVDSRQYAATQPTKRPTGTGYIFYLSDPWYQPANAIIENLTFVLDDQPINLERTK